MNRLNIVLVWILLALILLYGISGAMAQTPAAPKMLSGTPVQAYGASGSGQTAVTMGAIAAGSTIIPLASNPDFICATGRPCEYVLIPTAGHAFAAAQPSATASVVGSAGSSTRCYEVASLDGAGGVGIPVQTCVSTAQATLTSANHVSIAITAGGGATAYAIWEGSSASGPWTFMGTGQAATYVDTGFTGIAIPWWIPSTPPASAQNDWLVTQISGGGATTSLNIATPTVSATAGAVTILHDDTAAINAALNQSVGALVNIPCGTYNTSGALVFSYSDIELVGDGVCTRLQPSGTADDFDLIGTSSAELNADTIQNLYVVDTGAKASGFGIYGIWDTKLDISNVVIDHPYSGISLTNFNDVRMAHDRVFRFFGQQGNILALRSDATNSSCCFDGTDVYGHSNGTIGDQEIGQTGYLIDGNVSTVIARNFDLSNIAGEGLAVSNVVGNAHPPQFIQFTDYGNEYTVGRGVDLEAGSNIGFTGTSLVHAAGDGNFVSCASSADLYVASGATLWSWIGGGFSNASGDNVYVNATEGTLRPQKVIWGSAANIGGTLGQCPGVEFGGSAAYVSLVGAQIGDAINPSWQAEPILLDSGASNIVAVGNAFAGNANSTVVDNSGSITNVLVPNANDATPGWAFDHVHALFGIGTGSYSNNGSLGGMDIRQSAPGSTVRLSVTNIGSGASCGQYQSSTITGGSYALWGVCDQSGSPIMQLVVGGGVVNGVSVDASNGGAAAPLALKGGSAAGVTMNPFADLVHAYTVSALPSCTSSLAGALAYVTDASSPTYNASLTGGSSTKTLAMCNGSAWTAH